MKISAEIQCAKYTLTNIITSLLNHGQNSTLPIIEKKGKTWLLKCIFNAYLKHKVHFCPIILKIFILQHS